MRQSSLFVSRVFAPAPGSEFHVRVAASHGRIRTCDAPRLRQSLAALGSGYGLNEKPALRAKRIRDREAMIRPKKASLCYASMPT
jgi:hypothetical protein